MENRNKKYYLQYLAWYTVLFAITSVGVFWLFIANGKSFCWTTDAVSQYVPKAYYFMREVRELICNILKGDFSYQVYDFTQGLGDATALKLEPLYWIFALFSPEHVEAAYAVVHFVRFYAAGLSMSAFLFYFGNNRWETGIASMLYIYSGYGLFAGLRHSHFVVPLITLPLLLISMEEIYRRKRWYLCTIFVAISFWCGYYFTYMNTIAMGFYFLIRFFTGKEKRSVKGFFQCAGTIIWTYSLGILIANITFFNSFADYLGSSRTAADTEKAAVSLQYSKDWLKECYYALLSPGLTPGNWMRLGFTAISYLAILVLLIRRGRRSLKSALLLGVCGCAWPVVAYVFSGFDGVVNRWCYILAFIVAAITAFVLKDMLSLKVAELFLMGLGILPYIYYGVWKEFRWGKSNKFLFFAGLLLIGIYICIVGMNLLKRLPLIAKKSILSVLTVILLTGSGLMIYSTEYEGMISEFKDAGKVLKSASNTPLVAMEDVEDDSFYRSSTNQFARKNQNASLILDYYGISSYSSTPFKSVVDFYRTMGITTWNMGRLSGFGNRTFLDTLSSVKYFCTEKEETYDLPYGYEKIQETQKGTKVYEIYENQNMLPLGYTYEDTITAEELDVYPVIARQEVMMQAAVLDETVEDRTEASDIQITSEQVPIVRMYGEDVEVTENSLTAKRGGILHIEFEGLDNVETYLVFNGVKADFAGKYDMEFQCGDTSFSYILYCDENAYSTGQKDYAFHLGYREEAVNTLTIEFTSKCELEFEEMGIYCQSMENLQDYVTERKGDVLENVEIQNDGVSGTIQLEQPKWLVLSIPYQNGWTAFVDGEKASLEKVNLAYMGLHLEAGEHIIELRYSMPGLKISLLLSAVGIVIFVTALVIRRKRCNASQHSDPML